jgi:hypothetical protein
MTYYQFRLELKSFKNIVIIIKIKLGKTIDKQSKKINQIFILLTIVSF